ncbi:g11228 [Coccomyxa elongata]
MEMSSIGRNICSRVSSCFQSCWVSLTLTEISGAFGDVGTFVPLLVALVRVVGLDLGTTLIFTGVYNIASGLLFGIPMPVQPMKAIAAIALADQHMRLAHVIASGIFVSGVTFLLGVTRLITVFNRMVPDAIVRGLQLSVGLGLAQRGIHNVWFKVAEEKDLRLVPDESDEKDISVYLGLAAAAFLLVMLYPSDSTSEHDISLHPAQLSPAGTAQEPASRKGSGRLRLPQSPATPFANESADTGIGTLGSAQMTRNRDSSASLNLWLGVDTAAEPALTPAPKTSVQDVARRMPAALLVVFVGMVVAVVQYPTVVRALRLGPSAPRIIVPTLDEWRTGILKAGLAQLPLTTLNSVVAVCQLSADLFPLRPARPAAVACSVGAMNLVGAWVGAMPCCHGAGGLAGQVRFGAKSGAAPVFLGLLKLVLGLLFGSSLYQLLKAFPQPLLGSLMIFSGIELAASCGRAQGERGAALMLLTAAASMTLGSTAVAFLAGMAAAALLAVWDGGPEWVARSGSWIRHALCCLPASSTLGSTHHGTHYHALPSSEATGASEPDPGPHSEDAEYWGPPRHEESRPPLMPISQLGGPQGGPPSQHPSRELHKLGSVGGFVLGAVF